jgi:hypothetical protein
MKKYDVVATASIPGKRVPGGELDIYKLSLVNTSGTGSGPYVLEVREHDALRPVSELWLESYPGQTATNLRESAVNIFTEELNSAYEDGFASGPYDLGDADRLGADEYGHLPSEVAADPDEPQTGWITGEEASRGK